MTARRALLVFALLVCPTAAWADDVADARAAFEKGAALANEGRWSDALKQFETSVSLRPHAATMYNLGFCERALGHPTRAKKAFQMALSRDEATGHTELTPDLRATTKRYLEEATNAVATPELTVMPADVTITVDGRPLEPPAPDAKDSHFLAGTRPAGPGEKAPRATFVIEVDAGSHEIVISGPDGRSKVAHEYFTPGASKKVRIELPPPAVVVKPGPMNDNGTSRRTWGFVIGGVGLATIGVGAYFGLRASNLWNDATDRCPSRTNCSDAAADLSNDARRFANLSTIAVTAGAVAVIGGTVLVLTAPSSKSSVAVGLGSLSFTTNF